MERYIAQVKKATDPKVDNHMKEYIMLWDFSKPEVIEQWDCICDTDMDGFSHASFEPNSQGTPNFSKTLAAAATACCTYFMVKVLAPSLKESWTLNCHLTRQLGEVAMQLFALSPSK